MSVKEIIEELKKYPDDAKVYIRAISDYDRAYDEEVFLIEKRKDGKIFIND